MGWKLGFGELDNAHNEFKIEINQRKTGFMQRNPSSAKSEESSLEYILLKLDYNFSSLCYSTF